MRGSSDAHRQMQQENEGEGKVGGRKVQGTKQRSTRVQLERSPVTSGVGAMVNGGGSSTLKRAEVSTEMAVALSMAVDDFQRSVVLNASSTERATIPICRSWSTNANVRRAPDATA
eukprot:6213643-Pleurochrysis_carterae.AAC.1